MSELCCKNNMNLPLLFEGQKDRFQSTSKKSGELDMKNKQAEEILKNLQSSAYILLLHVWALML